MGRGSRYLKVAILFMRDGLKMGFVTGMEGLYQARWRYIRGCFRRIRCMGMGSFIGQMVAFMRASGTTTRNMGLANTFGQMGKFTKENSVKIIALVLVSFIILMVSALKATGKTERNMGKAITFTRTDLCSTQFIDTAKKPYKESLLITLRFRPPQPK